MAPSELSFGIAEDGLGAVRFEDALALFAGVAGENQLDLVAAIGADHGVGDAGIAAGGIENGPVVVQFAGALAIEHHVEGGPVLDAAAGVEILGLAVDFDAGELALNLFQAQQGRITDGREQRLGFGARKTGNRESVGHSHLFDSDAGWQDADIVCSWNQRELLHSESSRLYRSPQSLSTKGGTASVCSG